MDMEETREECSTETEVIHAKIPAKKINKWKNKGISNHFEAIKPKKDRGISDVIGEQTKKIKSEGLFSVVTAQTKKKIAILSFNTLYGKSDDTDEGRYVSSLASALVNEGQEVHVFTRKEQLQPENEEIGSVFYHRIKIDSSLSLLNSINRFGELILSRINRIEAHERAFDIIHCHNLLPAKAALKLVNKKDIPLYLTLRSDYNSRNYIATNKEDKKIQAVFQEIIKKSNKVIYCSEMLKQKIQTRFDLPEDKHILIPEAFNWEDFQGIVDQGEIKRRYNIGPIDPVILFVGELNNTYAPDIIVDAMPTLLRNNHRLHFVFVGEGELFWPIKVKAHYLYIEHAIRLVGHKEGRDLYELFQASDIIAIPNRQNTGNFQILAAWSAKKPIVVTKAGSCGLIRHEENGVLVYDNPESLIWGIERITSDWSKAHEMTEQGWNNLKENYTWNAAGKKMKGIYFNK